MLFSSSLLSSALKKQREHFSLKKDFEKATTNAFISFSVAIAVIFFVLELIVLYAAILIAIKCTKPGTERAIHVVLAITFTMPYLLLSIFFSDCTKKILNYKS